MHRSKMLAACGLLLAVWAAAAQHPRPTHHPPLSFSGVSALAFTARAVSFGPRPPGSPACHKLQAYILAELKRDGCQVTQDDFTASTPLGPVAMKNIVARFPGASGRIVAITGHYDTKSMPGTYFVGANDGGSSTGFLLELARVLARQRHKNDIYLAWFDGEEAFGQWSAADGTYGSRHLASKWAGDGTIAKVKALINVDMIGDKDLDILRDSNSSDSLRLLVWQTAAELGFGSHFLDQGWMEDDHTPFLLLGVNALDLIDFDYGPNNAYWHTDQDTMDKLSAGSLQIVGTVLVEVLKKLD